MRVTIYEKLFIFRLLFNPEIFKQERTTGETIEDRLEVQDEPVVEGLWKVRWVVGTGGIDLSQLVKEKSHRRYRRVFCSVTKGK